MASLFSRQGNADFFFGNSGRPIVLAHIGAHLGGMFERYSALKRGPRLDDRMVMVEPNPANTERLFRRIRMDNRLSLLQAAVSNVKGKGFFKYSGVPNVIGNGGRLIDESEIESGAVIVNTSIPLDSPEAIIIITVTITIITITNTH